MKFSQRIKSFRKEFGLNQEGYAKALQVSRAALGAWEEGRGMPQAKDLPRIAKINGCTVDYLLGIEDQEPETSFEVKYNMAPEHIKKAIDLLLNVPRETVSV